MATTIDIACPKCGEVVHCDYLKGSHYDLAFLADGLTSFRLECQCGFTKTYSDIPADELERLAMRTSSQPQSKLPFLLPGTWDLIPDGVDFSEANNHNPEVETECGRCSGSGRELASAKDACSQCQGTGHVTRSFFTNDTATMDASVNAAGWCKCPCCGFRFMLADKKRWTGVRHARCGQKLRIVSAP
jgi:hypothetical protein